MDGYKEFQGKTLDRAIEEACSYFNSAREKLEIEIVNDAKTGIFGLVGAKKAKVRARRMQVQTSSTVNGSEKNSSRRDTKSAANEERKGKGESRQKPERKSKEERSTKDTADKADKPEAKQDRKQPRKPQGENAEKPAKPEGGRGKNERSQNERSQDPAKQERPKRDRKRPARPAAKKQDDVASEQTAQQGDKQEADSRPSNRRTRGPRRKPGNTRGRNGREDNGRRFEKKQYQPAQDDTELANIDDIDDITSEPMPEANLQELDHTELTGVVAEVVYKLITPVIGETPIEAVVEENRVKVTISSGDNSGLLIGREGQTLSAFQYLANRIVAKKLGLAVRVQLDTGDYRERQDEKLRDIALHLADKAKNLGKPQSTRPLSSYHRRIVHLALQDDDGIQTRSKGDGPLKRVIIAKKR